MKKKKPKQIEPFSSDDIFQLMVKDIAEYAIIMLNPKGYILTWNKGAEKIKGYREREIIGKHFSCFYPANDIRIGKPLRELNIAAIEHHYSGEGLLIRKNGEEFWATTVVTALRKAGDLIGFGYIIRDITEQHLAREALEQRVRFLEILIENASKAMGRNDPTE